MEEELVKLREALQGHNEVMRRLHEGQGNTNTQNMTIDAGSKALWFGLWLSTTCCLVMSALNWKQAEQITDMQRKKLIRIG
jgi:general stress protein 26